MNNQNEFDAAWQGNTLANIYAKMNDYTEDHPQDFYSAMVIAHVMTAMMIGLDVPSYVPQEYTTGGKSAFFGNFAILLDQLYKMDTLTSDELAMVIANFMRFIFMSIYNETEFNRLMSRAEEILSYAYNSLSEGGEDTPGMGDMYAAELFFPK